MADEANNPAAAFTFDPTNLMGEGRVTEQEIDAISDSIQRAHDEIQKMRETG